MESSLRTLGTTPSYSWGPRTVKALRSPGPAPYPILLGPMKKHIAGKAVLAAVAVVLTVLLSACQRDVIVVGILEPNLGESIEDARTGFLQALDDADFRAGENVRFLRRNGEFREQPLDELAAELIDDEGVDYLFALGTPALRVAVEAAHGKQVFFTMSGDATIDGVADGDWGHGTIAAGAASPVPVTELMSVLRRLLPEVSVVGILFDRLDADSRAGVELLSSGAARAGLQVITTGVTDAGEVAQAATQAIAQGAELLVLSPSPLLDAEFGGIRSSSDSARIPVVGWSEGLAKAGALASVGIDFEDNGRLAGLLAARVLRGEDVGTEPVATENVTHLWLSGRAAERLGVPLPADLIDEAREIFR